MSDKDMELNKPAAPQESATTDSTLVKDESKKIESEVSVSATETPDYKALFETEKAKLARAEEAVVKAKKQIKKKIVDEEQESDDSDIENRVAQLVQAELAGFKTQVKTELISSEVDNLLLEVSSNPDERALIKHFYDNRLQKSGYSREDIREDLINAKIIANRDSILKTNQELSHALKSKATTQTSANVSSSAREVPKDSPEYSAEDQAFLAKYGVK